MQGVRLDREELIRTYGVTQRLAVRLGALLAKRLDVTPALLEMAGAGSPIEKLLLHPLLLERAESADTDLLRSLAMETGAAAEGPLTVAESEGRRTIALEEELLAERGWKESNASGLPALTPKGPAAAPGLLREKELARLFGAEELARLKLSALTGADERERISALRKLQYAPLSDREKGGLYLRVLLDPVAQVRAEALRSLETLGFDRDTADALRLAFSSREKERAAALRRIGDLLESRGPAERQIVAAVLLEMFREASPLRPDDPALDVLRRVAPVLAGQPEILDEVTRVALQHVMVDSFALGRPIRDLLLLLGEHEPRPIARRLWEELGTQRAPGARAVILGLLMDLEKEESALDRLCETVADEILQGEHDELVRQRLGHHMASLGPPAARALLDRFGRGAAAERVRLLPFLDALCVDHGLPAEGCNEAARRLVEALRFGDHRLRMEVMRTRVFHRRDIAESVREDLVAELVPMLRSFEAPDLGRRAAILLEDIGVVSAPALLKFVRRRPASPESDAAVRVLGRILSDEKVAVAPPGLVSALRDLAMRRVASVSNRLGGYAEALGRLAASSRFSAGETAEAFDLLERRLPKAAYYADVLAALGRIAVTDRATHEQRVRTAGLLGAVIERPIGEEETRMLERETAEGKTYELSGRLTFDSETVPAAVEGLRAIALAEPTTSALRVRIAEQLLRVWREVAEWKRVWGPNSAEVLAGALGEIAASGKFPPSLRAEAVRSLAGAIERVSVLRALARAFGAPGGAETDALAVEVAEKVLSHWITEDAVPEERELALTTATAAAARPSLNPRAAKVKALRDDVTQRLFAALRDGRPWATELLARFRDCPTLPAGLRGDIAERLRRATQVATRA